MKLEHVIRERLTVAEQELEITKMLLDSCDDCERFGFQMNKAKSESEIKTLKWVLGIPFATFQV